MKLKIKNFIFVNILLISVFVFAFFLINLFSERFYTFEKQEKVKNIVNRFVDESSEYSQEIIADIESDGETIINTFEFVDDEKNFNRLLGSGFHSKRLWPIEVWIVQSDIDRIKKGEIINKVNAKPKLKSSVAISIGKYENMVYAVAILLTSMEDTMNLFNRFYLPVILIVLVFSGIGILFYSNKMVNRIKLIQNTTKKISSLDFSTKIEMNTKDEFQELAENVMELSDKLETSIDGLKTRMKMYEEMNKNQREFISNAGHELKTPVTILESYAHGIKEKGHDVHRRKSYCDVIVEESERLKELINKFLNYSSINTKNIEFKEFEIDKALSNVLKKYVLDFEKKDLKLEIVIIENCMVNGNQYMIEQVFDNLISNAISFVDYGGNIKVHFNKTSDGIRISVFNDGEKIPEESLRKIWDPFYRTETSRSRKYGGTGLGLSIVAEILKKHGFPYDAINTFKGVEFYFLIKI